MEQLLAKLFVRKTDGGRSSALSNLIKNSGIVIPPSLFVAWQTTDLFVRIFCCAVVLIILAYYLYSHDHLLKKDPRWLCSEEYLIQDKYLDVIAKQGAEPRLLYPSEIFEEPKLSLTDKGETK